MTTEVDYLQQFPGINQITNLAPNTSASDINQYLQKAIREGKQTQLTYSQFTTSILPLLAARFSQSPERAAVIHDFIAATQQNAATRLDESIRYTDVLALTVHFTYSDFSENSDQFHWGWQQPDTDFHGWSTEVLQATTLAMLSQ